MTPMNIPTPASPTEPRPDPSTGPAGNHVLEHAAGTRPTRLSSRPGLAIGILFLAVLLAFGRVAFNDFTWWDDNGTIHHTPLLNPPRFSSLRYYWTTMTQGLYVPVTWTVWIVLARLAFVQTPDEM